MKCLFYRLPLDNYHCSRFLENITVTLYGIVRTSFPISDQSFCNCTFYRTGVNIYNQGYAVVAVIYIFNTAHKHAQLNRVGNIFSFVLAYSSISIYFCSSWWSVNITNRCYYCLNNLTSMVFFLITFLCEISIRVYI